MVFLQSFKFQFQYFQLKSGDRMVAFPFSACTAGRTTPGRLTASHLSCPRAFDSSAWTSAVSFLFLQVVQLNLES